MFVQPLIHGTMEEDWIDAYWVLFDCIWAVECAVTQRYVDLRRQTSVFGSNQIGASADETLELLYQSRTNLIVSIFNVTGPMMPPSSLLDSLAATLLDWNEDLDNFLSRQDSLLVSLLLLHFLWPGRVLILLSSSNALQSARHHLGVTVMGNTF